MRRAYAATLLFIAFLGGAGCTSTPLPVLRASSSDIEAALKAKLGQDVRFSTTTNVSVNPASGVVTLSGQVACDADREAAGRFASSVKGVAMIYNELHVASAPR
jgi:osmotically-inducible protein OsmY